MGIIRDAEAAKVRPVAFGSTPVERSRAEPVTFQQVDRTGAVVEPEPPTPQPVEPAAPPPPPVFDVPGEVLQAFYDQAIAQGLEDGKAQVFAELTVLQARYVAAVEQLVALSKELAAHNQRQILAVGCRVAEKVVRHAVQVNPEILFAMLDDELSKLEGVDEATIVCSGPDFEYVSENAPRLTEAVGGAFKLRVVPDPELEYGDFRIETRIGSVDGLIPSRIAEIEAAMTSEGGVADGGAE